MKANKIMLCLFVITALVFSSCSKQSPITDYNLVGEFGFQEIEGSRLADTHNLEATTELSSHAIRCEIVSVDKVEFTSDIGVFNFTYSVKVLELLMDARETIKVGDTIPVVSTEGYLKANEAIKLLGNGTWPGGTGLERDKVYPDDAYISCSTWDAIPIEVGKTYIMFITDEYLETEGVYAEIGNPLLYLCSSSRIFSTRSAESSQKRSDLEANIRTAAKNRTGRADEIGQSAYINELGQQQAKDSASAK